VEVAPCIELIPGANYYVVPKRIKPAPSEFVDQNTYYYRLVDGQMRLKGVALGPGWENWPFEARNLSCYKQKGEGEMAKPRINWEVVGHKIDELRAQGKSIELMAKEIGIGHSTVHGYLKKQGTNKRQTPPPNLGELGGENRNEGEKESAPAIIPEKEPTETVVYGIPPVNMPIGCSLPLEHTTEPQDEEMAKSDTVQDEETGEYITADIARDYGWPPNNALEKVLLEETINAHFAVRRVLNSPVALVLIKRLIEQGAV